MTAVRVIQSQGACDAASVGSELQNRRGLPDSGLHLGMYDTFVDRRGARDAVAHSAPQFISVCAWQCRAAAIASNKHQHSALYVQPPKASDAATLRPLRHQHSLCQPDAHGLHDCLTANQDIMMRARTICACSAMTCAFCCSGSSSICSGVRLMICASSAAARCTESPQVTGWTQANTDWQPAIMPF
jgi:hypothetical protein